MNQNKNIIIKGARVNNLKNISLEIPRKELVVITGVSGSGKSSLAFDTLYAEGQRRYVESLSSYARQFLSRMEKPDVDYIQGLSPALAIEQKAASGNPRSTVGTTTEIYDFLKLLFARTGKTYSPVSGELVTQDKVSDIVNWILDHEEGMKFRVMCHIPVRSKGMKFELEQALQRGFTRVVYGGEIIEIDDLLDQKLKDWPKNLQKSKEITLLIDRFILSDKKDTEARYRLSDSVQVAYHEGFGTAIIQPGTEKPQTFSQKFEKDGITFELPSVNLFSFNNPYGACQTCQGFGRILGIDEDLIIPDKNRSIFDNAISPWRGETMKKYQEKFIEKANEVDFPIHRPWFDLTQEERDMVWNGIGSTWGIRRLFSYIESKSHKIQYRVMLARYRGYTSCHDCQGTRIRKDANYVKVDGHSISELLLLQIDQLIPVMASMTFSKSNQKIADRLMTEIQTRLQYLQDVGLNYLTLNRKIATLSGGEMQRIRLATSLGSGLVGAMYILDEPSIGLHSRDTDRLIMILKSLRDKGNSVIVVEHDEAIIRTAKHIVDIGPGAGELGGEIVYEGSIKGLAKHDSLTGKYLSGKDSIPLPALRRKKVNAIEVQGAREFNLKNIDAVIPLNLLTVVTGLSGSGKTTLIKKILFPALRRIVGEYGDKPGDFSGLEGDVSLVTNVEMVDQTPIGRSARSNPATYIKVWDHVRDLYSKQQLAIIKNLKPGAFSFNVEGGRCEMCKGEGIVTIEMQFLPDITLTCESCKGKRFKQKVLDVKYKEKNIFDILDMTISEAWAFFKDVKKIQQRLEILQKVGLGYLRLGQSSSTLSGGEAQRVKLAHFLTQDDGKKGTIFIFDEPTTGLHFDDINKLLLAVNELIERGNTVVIIEHNLEIIKCADWIIDLGPEGGHEGGHLVYQGPLEGILKEKKSYTAKYLKPKLS